MHYIILDLEWDSAYSVKYKRFINQILQIGAVKLDEEFNIIDTFEETIKSSISKKVTKRFEKLTGITTEQMRNGICFDDTVDMFNDWMGDDTVTMTWSNSDLYSIMENEDFLLNDGRKFKIEKYLDLQKFIQAEMVKDGYTDKNQVALANAAEFYRISTDEFFLHTAKDDSLVCVKLLQKCKNQTAFNSMIKDTKNPEFYERLRFKPYCISEIDNKEINKQDLVFNCELCGHKVKRTTDWKYRNRWFSANFECKDCGNKFNGRVCFKKTYDGLIVRKKVCEIKSKSVTENDEMFTVS